MKTSLLALSLLLLFCSSVAQSHKATKAEAEYYTKVMKTLNGALPEKYKNWDRNLLSEGEDETTEGQSIFDRPGKDRDLFTAPCIYGAPYNDPTYQKLKAESDAVKGTDDASRKKKEEIDYKLSNTYVLSLRFMANFSSGEYFMYCKSGGYQKLPPPDGWDAQYFGSTENCFSTVGATNAGVSFFVNGTTSDH